MSLAHNKGQIHLAIDRADQNKIHNEDLSSELIVESSISPQPYDK